MELLHSENCSCVVCIIIIVMNMISRNRAKPTFIVLIDGHVWLIQKMHPATFMPLLPTDPPIAVHG